MSDDLQLIAKCVLIVLATAWILISYAKACKCDVCGAPYGVWRRKPYPGADVQLCRHHAQLYDSASRFQRVRFATLRGFWRRAA